MNKEKCHQFYGLIERIESDLSAVRAFICRSSAFPQKEKEAVVNIFNDAHVSLREIHDIVALEHQLDIAKVSQPDSSVK